MKRYGLILAFLTAAFTAAVCAQQPGTSANSGEEKGTYLGVLISPVPDVVYDQVKDLPAGQGVLVTHVLPDSPAAQAMLRRNDILLQYDDDKIRDCEHFARLISADKPDRKVKLVVLRGGERLTVEAKLSLGVVLKVAQANKPDPKDAHNDGPRGTAKAGSPPSVSVAATPLEGGKMKVTVEYYQDGTGRLITVPYEGTLDEIETKVQALPARILPRAQAALQRIRALELGKN
jgi:membrane-associated protease RseP (regulator of RpoE activity)